MLLFFFLEMEEVELESQVPPLSEGEVESNDQDIYISDDSEDERGEEEHDKDDRDFVESFWGPEFRSKTTRILNVLLKSAYIDPNFR